MLHINCVKWLITKGLATLTLTFGKNVLLLSGQNLAIIVHKGIAISEISKLASVNLGMLNGPNV